MLNECFTVESYLPWDLRMLLRNLTWHYRSCGKMHPPKQSCKMQTVLPRIWPCMQGKGDKKWSLGGWWRLEAMSSDEDVQHMEMPPLKDPHFLYKNQDIISKVSYVFTVRCGLSSPEEPMLRVWYIFFWLSLGPLSFSCLWLSIQMCTVLWRSWERTLR